MRDSGKCSEQARYLALGPQNAFVQYSDYLCQGGGTYYAFKQAADAVAPVTCDFDYEAFSSYLIVACDHEVPDSYAEPQGRIAITG